MTDQAVFNAYRNGISAGFSDGWNAARGSAPSCPVSIQVIEDGNPEVFARKLEKALDEGGLLLSSGSHVMQGRSLFYWAMVRKS